MMYGVKGHPLGPSFAVAAAGLYRRPSAAGAPRGTRNYSTAAASSSPTRACFPPACPSCSLHYFFSKVFAGIPRYFYPNLASTLRSAATAQQLRTEGRVVCRRLCRQHTKVKLDKASQLVLTDVFH